MDLRALCRALLVVNVLYCVLALTQEGLPGWHMFEAVERLDFALEDKDGRPVDVTAALPRGVHLVDRGELERVVRWVCQRDKTRAPFTLRDRATSAVATFGDDCAIHANR